MYYSETTVRLIRDPTPARREQITQNHLISGWFPANSTICQEIAQKARALKYQDNPDLLRSDLSKDFSILGHLIRTGSSGGSLGFGSNTSIFQELTNKDPTELAQCLERGTTGISKFQLKDAGIHQVKTMQHAVRGACASYTFARATQSQGIDIDPDQALLTSSILQIVKNLIAWNYPVVYQRALYAAQSGDLHLFDQLKRVLGVSPQELCQRFSREWGMSNSVVGAYRNAPARPQIKESESPVVPSENQMLANCSMLGELYADLSDPRHFPNAENRWQEKSKEIRAVVGDEKLENLLTQIDEEVHEYAVKLREQVQDPNVRSELWNTKASRRSMRLFVRNQSIERCAPEVKFSLQSVYGMFSEKEEVSIDALRSLLTDTVFRAGFARGCIYLLKKDGAKLIPAVRLGPDAREIYQVVETFRQSNISQAVYYDTPVHQDYYRDGRVVEEICASLGGRKVSGVLLLEIAHSRAAGFEDLSLDYMAHFKAIRCCLVDCLCW